MRMTRRATTAVAVAGLSLLAGCSQTNGTVPGVSDSPDAWWTGSPSATSGSVNSRTATHAAGTASATTTPAPAAASGPCGYAVAGKAARPVDMPPSDNIEKTGSTTVTLTINDAPVVLTVDRAMAPVPPTRLSRWPSRAITTTPHVTNYLRRCQVPPVR